MRTVKISDTIPGVRFFDKHGESPCMPASSRFPVLLTTLWPYRAVDWLCVSVRTTTVQLMNEMTFNLHFWHDDSSGPFLDFLGQFVGLCQGQKSKFKVTGG